MMVNKFCLLLAMLGLMSGSSFGQSSAAIPSKISVPEGMESLNSRVIVQSGLYNGRDYQFYSPLIQGTAFFQDASIWESGWLVYNGIRFNSVPLMYDLNKDLLVAPHYNGISKYSFVAEKVSEFYLLGHHFVNILPDSIISNTLRPGFYDELYRGRLRVLAKRTKSIQVLPGTNTTKRYFSEKNNYFLEIDGRYHPINNERSFLSLFDDEKREMRMHLKENKIRYRSDPEKAMVLLATYYDTLP